MRWFGNGEWRDYAHEKGHMSVASYAERRGYWVVVWMIVGVQNERLPRPEYTEEQVRNHIELKYKLLKGD